MIEGACSLLRNLSRKVTAGCSRDRGAHSLSPSSAHAPEASPPVLQLLPICRTPLPHPGCQQAGGVSQGPAGQGCPQMMGKISGTVEGPNPSSPLWTPRQICPERPLLVSAVRIPGLLSCGRTNPVHLCWGLFLPKSDQFFPRTPQRGEESDASTCFNGKQQGLPQRGRSLVDSGA